MHYRLFLSFSLLFLISCFEDQSTLATLNAQHNKASRELQERLSRAEGQREALRRELARQIGLKRNELRDPTWEELKDFLQADQTDELKYIEDEFDCNGFALTLYNNAWFSGFRSAYVFVGYQGQNVGHALNKFELKEGELVYVDNTGMDRIAYVQKGKPYVTIPIESVRAGYRECSDFRCISLVEDFYTRSLFAYEYSIRYRNRVENYRKAFDLLNADIQSFNSNLMRTRAESAAISIRKENLDRVLADLGGKIFEPSKENIASTIEEYWN